ncbi:flagellar hook-length control protein FliK [Sulfurimonas sp.]|uniref:flagellar hook-length control protein FliK n=1 Tax=Sulfurimonas sp. TaxID=2022749 RepID=UPI003562992D
MISLETKTDVAPSSSIGLSTPEKEPTLSFSQLLKGAGEKDGKVVQNGALVLSLSEEKEVKSNVKASSKADTLLSLLKGKEAKESDVLGKSVIEHTKEPLELNPKITQTMTTKEIKALVSDAKEYLKSKILESDGYKQSQIKELPKTLKGLATLAKNFGIDISKVSIEEVKLKVSSLDSEKTLSTKEVNESKSDLKTQTTIASDKDSIKVQSKTQDIERVEDKKVVESTKQTPLFKAQDAKEHTTEQIVTVKQFKIEEKTPKEKADETLRLLLRGEKPSASNGGLTADFSVATARVIAPSASSEATRSLEKLLHGESSNEQHNGSNAKLETSATLKADSFEVKLNEAKQMIKYISQDVKTAIEDYKSPFTRVKVQLNPQKLGEVDLTIVQRGKNLHVNISSNNAAINTLSMNANELKVQLSNNGINNATLNFNNSSQNSDQGTSQQQNRHNERRADEEYNYFDNEEQNEEVLSSLEIVVPNYA